MDTFWALTGFLPLLVIGPFFYWLFVVLPRRSKSNLAAGERNAARPAPVRPDAAPSATRDPTAVSSSSTEAVTETVSVVLRRQVPPRFDEPARSWLGGLPRMPKQFEWPRSVSSERPEQGERPLHFLAQICCADLPSPLWGGLGPRDGWLLLFIDPNQGTPEGNDAFQIVHVPQPGPEREPPFDLGPVHDGVYTGADYRHLPPGQKVPSVWRRWPVDLVVVANEAREQEGRVLVAPDNFASLLYPGEKIADDRDQPVAVRPFTFEQALHALYELRAGLERSIPPLQLPPGREEDLRKEGAISERMAFCAQQAARYEEERVKGESGKPGEHVQRSEWYSATIDRFEREEAWLRERSDADSVLRYLAESSTLEAAWQEQMRAQVDAAIEAIRQRDPEAPLPEAEWNDMVAAFRGEEFTRWQSDRPGRDPGQPGIAFREYTRTIPLNPPRAMHELVADMYTDASRKDLIPDYALAEYEPRWRQLRSNRPHRLGGYHDGLQSDATIGPARELLLFQIASDEAMNWCWGDVGAYYFWIRPKHLAAGDFSGVQMHLECH